MVKIYSKLLGKFRRNRSKVKTVFGAVGMAIGLRYGQMNLNLIEESLNSNQKDAHIVTPTIEVEEILESESSTHLIKIQTGSGVLIGNSKISEGSESALAVRSGDQTKFGPGARAKADAAKNAEGGKVRSGSGILSGVDGFVTPSQGYCHYRRNLPNVPESCRRATTPDSPFGPVNPHNDPSGDTGSFDSSQYKGGPSPFSGFDYKDPSEVADNIGFNKKPRLNKSYDKHAEDCFGRTENRNKENLEKFKGDVTSLAKSADRTFTGSYRYQTPAYSFLKEVNGKPTLVVVDATDLDYITVINPTTSQLDNLIESGNFGLDTRPSLQLTLRLRGPGTNGN